MKRNLILSLTSAVLLISGWIGFSGAPLLVALVPLLLISDGYDRSRRSFWRTYGWVALALVLWSLVTTWWIWYAVPFGAVLSVVNNCVLFGGMFMLYHWISKRAPKSLAYTLLVAGWIACEYLYTIGQIAFPWLTLGNGFTHDIPLIQWYDTTGVFGGSLWVLVSNLLFFRAVKARRKRSWMTPAAFVLTPVIISLTIYWTYEEKGEPVTVTVVQPNIDAWSKFSIGADYQTRNLLELSAKAPSNADYIVMPETALHNDITENNIASNGTLAQFRELARTNFPQAQYVIGASSQLYYLQGMAVSETARYSEIADIHYDEYNSALAVDTTANVQIHHKSKLLVGAEMIPFYPLMKKLGIDAIIKNLGGPSGQLGYDNDPAVFTHPATGLVTAAPICWEGVFGQFYSGFVQQGAQLMFIISNDGWWRDTQGHRQLFAFSRLRAVETRRAIGRSANTGISGFITQRGDVLNYLGWAEHDAITTELRTNDKMTFYTRYGDYIARVSSLVFFLCLLYYVAWSIKRRNKLNI